MGLKRRDPPPTQSYAGAINGLKSEDLRLSVPHSPPPWPKHPSIKRCVSSLALVAGLAWTSVSPVTAQGAVCPGTHAEIMNAAGAETDRLCEAARATEAFFTDCGLAPKRHYGVRLVGDVRNAIGGCIFGQFRNDPDVASILTPSASETLVATIPSDEPLSIYKRLPPADLHRSLVIHEIAHAVAHQSFAVAPCHAAHEYIASVAQISALPEATRRTFLAAFEGQDSFADSMFNDLVQAMNPARFTAAAYRHFQRPENGCAFMRRLLTDHTTIPRVD